MTRYEELKWYGFGLRAGLTNLRVNRGSLGWKKTFGKILQPINMYTRFPEYYLFHTAVQPVIVSLGTTPKAILDVGSPKLFGFYLASAYGIKAYLTDLNERDIVEYSTMWSALSPGALGIAVIERQDVRALTYPDDTFDVAYSMSAIEHVEGDRADSLALKELWRVMKPQGLLVVSLPFGDRYMEQTRRGFSWTATPVDTRKEYFFQRVYDKEALETRLIGSLEPRPPVIQVYTVYRSRAMSSAAIYHRLRKLLGLSASGVLGFLNPLLSILINRHCEGYPQRFLASYGPSHSLADIYADAVIVCRKPTRGE